MPAVHAPRGGVTIRGKTYLGGMFIPADVIESLTPEERADPVVAKLHAEGGRASSVETSSKEHFGTFDHDEYNRAFERVKGTLAGKDSVKEVETWPEYANHVKWGSQDPHFEALKSRVWSEYATPIHRQKEARLREMSAGKPSKPSGHWPDTVPQNDRRWGQMQFREAFDELEQEAKIDYGIGGPKQWAKHVERAWGRPLTAEEAEQLDAEVMRADRLSREARERGEPYVPNGMDSPAPGYPAAEARVRLAAAQASMRAELGPPQRSDHAEALKALIRKYRFDHRPDEVEGVYRDGGPNDETAEVATARTTAELDRRRKLFEAANAEFEAAHGDDHDSDKLRERYETEIEEGTADPMGAAIEKHRAHLADPMAGFMEDYHGFDDVEDRVRHFGEELDAGNIDPAKLSEDDREIIADDLANQLKAAESVLADFGTRYDAGEVGPDEKAIWASAISKLPDGAARAFDPKKRSYTLVDVEDQHPEDAEIMRNAARAAGIVWQSGDGSKMLVERHGAGEHLTGDFWGDGASHDLDDDADGDESPQAKSLRHIFNAQPNPTVSEHDVPAAARNFGRVSGGEGGADVGDFDPDDVDVYKPVSKDWYVLRRGHKNPHLGDKPRYELVHRTKTGMRVGLPPQFWEKMTDIDPADGFDEDARDEAARRDERQGKGEQKARLKVRTAADRLKAFKKSFGKLADRHNQLEQRKASAEAHFNKAEEAMGALNNLEYTLTGDKSEEAEELVDAVNTLHADAEAFPEGVEFDLTHVNDILRDANTAGQQDSRKTLADEYTAHAKDMLKQQKGFRDQLQDSEDEFDTHFETIRSGWEDVLAKAKAVIVARRADLTKPANEDEDEDEDEDEEGDPADAKEEARRAIEVAKLAKRQLRKIERLKGGK